IIKDVVATHRLLAGGGIPVAPLYATASADEIVPLAREIGLPVTVHTPSVPNNVYADRQVVNDEQALIAIATAIGCANSAIIVQKYLPGREFSVLVVDGAVLSVVELPRKIVSSSEVTSTYAWTRREWGTALHPENRRVCEIAAAMSNLPVVGVVFRSLDVATPYWENDAVVTNVDSEPDLTLHGRANPRAVRKAAKVIVKALFPTDHRVSVPIVAITGTNGKTTTARLLAHILRGNRLCVGINSTDGAHIGHQALCEGGLLSALVAPIILSNPTIDVAIFEETHKSILMTGLPYERPDIGIVTNVTSDHIGALGITSLAELARVKAVVAAAVKPGGHTILNADDPLVYGMRTTTPGNVVLFSAREDGCNPTLDAHCVRGGTAAQIDDGHFVLREASMLMPIAHVRDVPLTLGGTARCQYGNVLAAIAAAFVSGLSCDTIQAGLLSFSSSPAMNPGRMNLLHIGAMTVLVDYAHNVASLAAVIDFATNYPATRRLCVLGVPADRRDDDIIACGRIAAAFDYVVVRERDTLGERSPGAVAQLLVRGLDAGGMRDSQREVVLSERESVARALELGGGGDLVVLLACDVEAVIAQALAYTDPNGTCGSIMEQRAISGARATAARMTRKCRDSLVVADE
ncbi:MAG: Mur ligase family protein, partial [Gemmatimonadaceae bacterium]